MKPPKNPQPRADFDGYGSGIRPPDNMTVVEVEREERPLLYDANGTALCLPKRRIGYRPPTA